MAWTTLSVTSVTNVRNPRGSQHRGPVAVECRVSTDRVNRGGAARLSCSLSTGLPPTVRTGSLREIARFCFAVAVFRFAQHGLLQAVMKSRRISTRGVA